MMSKGDVNKEKRKKNKQKNRVLKNEKDYTNYKFTEIIYIQQIAKMNEKGEKTSVSVSILFLQVTTHQRSHHFFLGFWSLVSIQTHACYLQVRKIKQDTLFSQSQFLG